MPAIDEEGIGHLLDNLMDCLFMAIAVNPDTGD
jgi:hypothetical protein